MKSHSIRRCALIGAAMIYLFSGATFGARFSEPSDDVGRVYELIDSRLALMADVAAWKWTHSQPVFDGDREQAVIDGIVARAREFGLEADSVRKFFEIQVQMARAVQTDYFEMWRQEGFHEAGQPRDLQNDLRPALDALGEELLTALFWARGEFQKAGATESIARALRRIASNPGVTAQDLARLRAALNDVRGDPKGVDTVTRLRVLRVGTTGDYAPFSSENGGELKGLDIELAEALAAHLKLRPRFVRTSWPTLTGDLQAGRFDVALSGISNTPERAAQGEFSTAYHFDGKTPIARCEDRSRFGSLNDIDRAEVRIIVNPGGTNQQFVREHIEHAKVVAFPDNKAVFDEIIAKRADVMITDAIEADLQTRRHKELCRTMSGTLTNTAKAVLLPQGSPLTKAVDQWLQTEVARGGVQEKLQRAMME